jgi:hypothetical protein
MRCFLNVLLTVSLIVAFLVGCDRKVAPEASAAQSPGQPVSHTTGEAVREGQPAAPPVSHPQALPASDPEADSFDKEAVRQAWNLLRRQWTQCGLENNWFSIQRGQPWGSELHKAFKANRKEQIVELKGVEIRLPDNKEHLTEADKLNGIEWKGSLVFSFAAARTYQMYDEFGKETTAYWTQWWSLEEKARSQPTYRIHLVKKHGQWMTLGGRMVGGYKEEYDPLSSVRGPEFSQPFCDQLKLVN